MSTLEDLEKQIIGLSKTDMEKFRAWFFKLDGMAWDEQIESDMQTGKLDALAKLALKEHQNGHTKEMQYYS